MDKGTVKHRHARSLREEFEEEVREIEHLQRIIYNRRKAQFKRIKLKACKSVEVIQRTWRSYTVKKQQSTQSAARSKHNLTTQQRVPSSEKLLETVDNQASAVTAPEQSIEPPQVNNQSQLLAPPTDHEGQDPQSEPTVLPNRDWNIAVDSTPTPEDLNSTGVAHYATTANQHLGDSTTDGSMNETAPPLDRHQDDDENDQRGASSSSGNEDNSYADDDDFHSYEQLDSARTTSTRTPRPRSKPSDPIEYSPTREEKSSANSQSSTDEHEHNDRTTTSTPNLIQEGKSDQTEAQALDETEAQTHDYETSGEDVVSDLDELFLE